MKPAANALLALALACALPTARAGIIEDLLALPAIQSLLGRVPELQSLAQNCNNPAFRQRNAQLCLNAENASKLARMPVELRAVMSNPTTAASMRELCLAVQNMPVRDTFLCVQLAQADLTFQAQMQRERIRMEQESASPR